MVVWVLTYIFSNFFKVSKILPEVFVDFALRVYHTREMDYEYENVER